MLMSPPSLLTIAPRAGGPRSLRHRRTAHGGGRSSGCDLLHHLLHLTVLLQQLIDLLHTGTRAGRDPAAARAVDHRRVAALRRRHGEAHLLAAVELLVIDLHVLHLLADPGDHTEQRAQRPHLADATEL